MTTTASFGVVSTRPGRDESDANLKLRADEALYAAKDAGRDCVRIWNPEMKRVKSGEREAVPRPATA